MENLCAVILAAGKGTRMRSNRAKVLHNLCGTPMLRLVYSAVAALEPEQVFVVIGQDAERVCGSLEGFPAYFVHQKEQLGTGHAAMAAGELLSQRRGHALVVFGDAPRIKAATLRKLVQHHRNSKAVTSLDLIDALGKLTNNNAQKEYYITDLVAIQRQDGKEVEAVLHDDFEELRGINTRRELAELSRALSKQKNLELMESGVTLIDPDCAYVDLDVVVEKDVILYPMVTLEGRTRIGEGTVVRSGTRISNSRIAPEVEILESCLITDSEIGSGTTVGPSARVRDQAVIGSRCRIGNFVEIKKSTLGDGTKAAHLAYVGDAVIGRNVNIGAGTITCNFDGQRKNVTTIEDDAFIGTDSQLVAPVRIGRGAYVAAGSCITEDVPPEALAVARARQINKEGWVRRKLMRTEPK